MIKEENKRITITLTQKQIEYLDVCKNGLKVKTYGCVIRRLIDFDIEQFRHSISDLFDK